MANTVNDFVTFSGGKRGGLRMRKKNKTYRRKGNRSRKSVKRKGTSKNSKGPTCYVYKYVKKSCKNLKM